MNTHVCLAFASLLHWFWTGSVCRSYHKAQSFGNPTVGLIPVDESEQPSEFLSNLWGRQNWEWFYQQQWHVQPGAEMRLSAHLELSLGGHTWPVCLLVDGVCMCVCVRENNSSRLRFSGFLAATLNRIIHEPGAGRAPAPSREHPCYFRQALGRKFLADNGKAPGVASGRLLLPP